MPDRKESFFGGVMEERELRAFLQAFYRWYEEARGPMQQCSRARVLLICLLVRFAGLRLGEALAVNDTDDIDEAQELLHVRGKWERDVPLPRTALKKILELRDAPCNVREKGRLCRLDQGYVRRIFSQRAKEAGLDGVNPTDIRDFREQELLRQGVSLPAVELFLGRGNGRKAGERETARIREAFRLWEGSRQAGRHNIVSGKPELVWKGELSCLIHITPPSGPAFAVRCSTRALSRLDILEQKEVSVFVRSLQVRLPLRRVREQNCFSGRIVDILECGEEARVMVRLDQGGQEFCAVLSRMNLEELRAERGKSVWVLIRPEDFTFGNASSLPS
ncbi:TOBE domain-containing protein [Mailhella massiliensis]|uniref:TOBE domain-containing protein n=1 Tax=Mailhella massiliensis TaxID=1903261 RepID=UPI0023553EFE|nr:TOBE domain-containing protein [Mailhella massiliensis]